MPSQQRPCSLRSCMPIMKRARFSRLPDCPQSLTRCGALFHSDAAQSAGKIKTNVDELGVDLLTLVGHKVYAPKGIGALYVRAGTPLDSVIHGASQERGRRAGTENVPYIVSLGVACRLAHEKLETDMPRVRRLRDRFQDR